MISYTGNGSATVTISTTEQRDPLEMFSLNEIIVEHKVQTQELMKLKDIDVNYADHIKSNLTSKVAERIMPRMTFTKSQNPDMEEHIFRGRLWVFTKSELEELIKEAKGI